MTKYRLVNWETTKTPQGSEIREAEISHCGYSMGSAGIIVRADGYITWQGYMKVKYGEASHGDRAKSVEDALDSIKCWIDEVG